jgi:hypothetical protein
LTFQNLTFQQIDYRQFDGTPIHTYLHMYIHFWQHSMHGSMVKMYLLMWRISNVRGLSRFKGFVHCILFLSNRARSGQKNAGSGWAWASNCVFWLLRPGCICSKIMLGLGVWPAGLAQNPGPCGLGLLFFYVAKAQARRWHNRPGPDTALLSNWQNYPHIPWRGFDLTTHKLLGRRLDQYIDH